MYTARVLAALDLNDLPARALLLRNAAMCERKEPRFARVCSAADGACNDLPARIVCRAVTILALQPVFYALLTTHPP